MYHILIVDEEEHLLWALERNLFPKRDDVQVHTAISGEAGLEIMQRESIDLLISDIKMPGEVDGFQLILRAKEMVPDARIMIITAFGTHRIQNFAERIGISHYIEKPFTVDDLRQAILEILDEKEGFQGVLSDLELTDIIQMLCLAKRTALLHLKHRDHRGRIVFDAGDVVHAEFDGIVGVEAVFEMLDLRQGDIFMQSEFDAVERTVEMGWQDLLLEGVKRADERRLKEAQEKTRQERAEQAQASQVSEDSEAEEDLEQEEQEQEERRARRTMTPIGMGAPPLDFASAEVDQEEEPHLGESSSGLIFSEAELEEMAMASEAVMDEEKEERERNERDFGNGQKATEPETIVMDASHFQMPKEAHRHDDELEPAPVEDDSEASHGEETGRRRRGTSPGMAALSLAEITEESGEYELFAAPALNGRHIDFNDDILSEAGREALQEFVRECPGLRVTALVGSDDRRPRSVVNLLEDDTSLDNSEMSARLVGVFHRALRSVQALRGDDNLQELQLTLREDYVLIRAVESRAMVHIAIVDRQANLGIALVLMRQLGRRLGRQHSDDDLFSDFS